MQKLSPAFCDLGPMPVMVGRATAASSKPTTEIPEPRVHLRPRKSESSAPAGTSPRIGLRRFAPRLSAGRSNDSRPDFLLLLSKPEFQ
jgi:hypothetical protein